MILCGGDRGFRRWYEIWKMVDVEEVIGESRSLVGVPLKVASGSHLCDFLSAR